MTKEQLLARVKDLRDQRGRAYDSELQILLSEIVAHLEEPQEPTAEEIRQREEQEWHDERPQPVRDPCGEAWNRHLGDRRND